VAEAHPPAPATPPSAGTPVAQLSPDRAYVWNGAAWATAEFSPDGRWVWDGGAWRPVPPPPPPPPPAAAASSAIAPPIEFDFPVGNQEQHKVRFRLDQAISQLTIDVDGDYIVNETQQFSLSMSKQYRFSVGKDEQHAVIIEKRRELLMTGNKPYTFRVWIDEAYHGTYQGDTWVQSPA
jgi:hypothetical protein